MTTKISFFGNHHVWGHITDIFPEIPTNEINGSKTMNIVTHYHVVVKILCISMSELCDLIFEWPRKKISRCVQNHTWQNVNW